MLQSATIKSNKLICFLTEPRYRFYRHLLAITAIGVISFNTAYLTFLNHTSGNLSGILLLGAIQFVLFLIIVYFNVYVLIPRLLLKEKYAAYVFTGSIIIIAVIMAGRYSEYAVSTSMNIPLSEYSYYSDHRISWLDILAEYLIDAICFAGMTVTVLLRQWIFYGEKKNDLEKSSLRSEVDQMKNKVNPVFMFSMLDFAADTVQNNPQKASDVLMRLSKFLRYQLYDSSRTLVMLNSEIKFLENYLSMEIISGTGLKYDLHTKGNMGAFVVPPMLVYTLVQYFLKDRHTLKAGKLSLMFENKDNKLSIICSQSSRYGFMDTRYINDIRKRLEIYYPDSYRLIPDIYKDTAIIRVTIPNKRITA